MKYRVNYTDLSWLFFTPFAFLNMGGTDHWEIQSKKHWWSKWKTVGYSSSEPEDIYIKYFKLKYNIEIKKYIEVPSKDYKKTNFYYLEFYYNSYSKDHKYCVGYKTEYSDKYYCIYYSDQSYEDALLKLWELGINNITDKNYGKQ